MIGRRITFAMIGAAMLFSCASLEDADIPQMDKKVSFDISVSRDGKILTKARTRSDVDVYDADAMLDPNTPFGLLGVDSSNGKLLVGNERVYQGADGNWDTRFALGSFGNARTVSFSAYYPFVDAVEYNESTMSYAIPYTDSEVGAGPLVSKTVQKAIIAMDMVPLEFQHVSNDIGYMICDVTPSAELQGLVHLKKVVARNVATQGVYIDTLSTGRGVWKHQGKMTDIVVFSGDEKVPVGTSNELFVGSKTLEPTMKKSARYYSVPDEIRFGYQYIEVTYDIDGFTLNNFYYKPVKDHVAKYMLYGLLPDNVFQYGKQYTFHIGIDLSGVYSEITFSPTVSGWETHIYENNTDF